MERCIYILLILLFLLFPTPKSLTEASQLETVIIEVEGNIHEHKEYLETHHPLIEIVATYSTLFQGFALQAKSEQLERLDSTEFIKGVYQNQEYQAKPLHLPGTTELSLERPSLSYTGKNINVAVIDTGVDYTHPDLQANFQGGYDLIDFDDDPMETLPSEGMPTNHGTHVAGIIAADGEIAGIAPGASISAYRALGPGGIGSTLHVLAALEQAVKDQVDVINLSLGNQVNGPDYPTSVAVNRAIEQGIPVVVANGNSGPERWTVGSPATAEHALSVGASQFPIREPLLYHALADRKIEFIPMQGALAWNLEKDHQVMDASDPSNSLQGKIALYERGKIPFQDIAREAEEKGAAAVLIFNNEEGTLQGMIDPAIDLEIPIAGVSQEDGRWLKERSGEYIDTHYEEIDTTITDFSSRGPVTVDWQIKPDLVAFGRDIKSTIPGGYERFSGTSMAAPYVTGAIALLKEAHPTWGVNKLFSALRTTAAPITTEEGTLHPPSVQGHGLIQVEEAIETSTIIYNSSLEAGRITDRNEKKEFTIEIENRGEEEQRFSFDIPKIERGMNWHVPMSFSISPGETKEIPIELDVKSKALADGVYEGFLSLEERTTNVTYHLPYLFINQSADQPKIAGIEFSVKPFNSSTYSYSLYLTEELELLSIDLYDIDTLAYRGNLLDLKDPVVGANEGEIPGYHIPKGNSLAIVTAINTKGEVEIAEMPIVIE
jgi:minor extracellular serine protease Vpr